MAIGYIVIFIFLLTILAFVTGLGMVFIYHPLYALLVIAGACILYFIALFTFYKYTKKELQRQAEILLSLSPKAKETNEKNSLIEFEQNGEVWICKKDENLKLNLKGYMFQKSFILAWIIRNQRYDTISNKLKIGTLFKYRLKIKKTENLTVRFIYKNKTKEYLVVKNYLSRNNFLTKAITESAFSFFFTGKYSYYNFRKIMKVNEKIYLYNSKY